jgi:DNA-binding NarL/FixJ family response regulator
MRILVVDDHEVVRRGICSVLATESSLTLCGEAVDGKDAVEKARVLRPDIIVMDITMPQMNGLDATREIKRLLPDTEIVIVSQHEAPEMVRQAFNAGARAYVVKSTVAKELLAAIAKVNKGEPFVKAAAIVDASHSLDPADVLQRSAAFEKALRVSEEGFRSAMTNMAEGLVMLDAMSRDETFTPVLHFSSFPRNSHHVTPASSASARRGGPGFGAAMVHRRFLRAQQNFRGDQVG